MHYFRLLGIEDNTRFKHSVLFVQLGEIPQAHGKRTRGVYISCRRQCHSPKKDAQHCFQLGFQGYLRQTITILIILANKQKLHLMHVIYYGNISVFIAVINDFILRIKASKNQS